MIRPALFALLLLTCGSQARTFHTLDDALAGFYPDTRVERLTHYLSPEQEKAVAEQAGGKPPPAIVYAYRVYAGETLQATVYFDKHRVRTLPETLLVAVTPSNRIDRIEVIAFNEPMDYLPRARWYAQFPGRWLHPEFRLKREIDGVTGATLTARATVEAARRVLALHALLTSVADE